MDTRVIVADNGRARIFASKTGVRQLEEMEGFVHSEAHLANQDIDADAAGRSRDPHGSLDHATSAREHESQMFAKSLARHLKELHNDHHFEQLVLVAPPRFLGLLRQELPKPLDKLVSQSIDKDLTRSSLEDIVDHLWS
jgi:protein required for attachment to host cells